jgi:hypothetical protein
VDEVNHTLQMTLAQKAHELAKLAVLKVEKTELEDEERQLN